MTTWAEVKKHLRNGYKVAIEITEGFSVFAQKTDYIAESERKGATNEAIYSNYDGDAIRCLNTGDAYAVSTWFDEDAQDEIAYSFELINLEEY